MNGPIRRTLIRKVFLNGNLARLFSKAVLKVYQLVTPMLGWDPSLVSPLGFGRFGLGFCISDTIIIDLKGYGLNQEGVWNLNDDQCITETGCFDVEGFCTDSGINPWYVANFFFAKMN